MPAYVYLDLITAKFAAASFIIAQNKSLPINCQYKLFYTHTMEGGRRGRTENGGERGRSTGEGKEGEGRVEKGEERERRIYRARSSDTFL